MEEEKVVTQFLKEFIQEGVSNLSLLDRIRWELEENLWLVLAVAWAAGYLTETFFGTFWQGP